MHPALVPAAVARLYQVLATGFGVVQAEATEAGLHGVEAALQTKKSGGFGVLGFFEFFFFSPIFWDEKDFL